MTAPPNIWHLCKGNCGRLTTAKLCARCFSRRPELVKKFYPVR